MCLHFLVIHINLQKLVCSERYLISNTVPWHGFKSHKFVSGELCLQATFLRNIYILAMEQAWVHFLSFDFALMSITLGHLALRDTDEKHSLLTLPQSLSNFHLACAGPSKTAFKTEPCIQPLSYPIYYTLSAWNNFHQTTRPSFSICWGSCQSCLVLSF